MADLHIACCATEGYLPHFAALVASYARFHSPLSATIWLLHDGISELNKGRLARLEDSTGTRIVPIYVCDMQGEIAPLAAQQQYHPSVCYRLLLDRVLPPELLRVLYLDVDIVLNGSLLELWETDLDAAVLAAVSDAPAVARSRAALLGTSGYFNSGVLLINLVAWRRENVGARCLSELPRLLADSPSHVRFPDQDVLNMFARPAVFLDKKWNLLPTPEAMQQLRVASRRPPLAQDPIVIHFAARKKPWMYGCRHPFTQHYWHFLRTTPWAEMPVQGRTPGNVMLRYTPKKLRPLVTGTAARIDAYYRQRIARPADWIKQPAQDILRLASRVCYRALSGLRRQSGKCPTNPTRFLLIRRNRLGDAICILPLAHALKQTYPLAKIEVLATPYNADIFRLASHIDRVWEVPEKYLGNRLMLYWHPVVRALRQSKFDVVVNASAAYSSHAARLSGWMKARWKIGVVSSVGSIHDLNYNAAVRLDHETLESHQIYRIAAVAQAGGLRLGALPWVAFDRTYSAERAPASSGRLPIIICPDVNRKESAWPVEYYQKLIALLSGSLPSHPVYLATVDRLSPYRILLESGGVMDAGHHGLIDFAHFLSSSGLVICAEGGVSHLAPAAGTPTIVLSGKTISGTWVPWSPLALLLESPGDIGKVTPEMVLRQAFSRVETGRWLTGEFVHSVAFTLPPRPRCLAPDHSGNA